MCPAVSCLRRWGANIYHVLSKEKCSTKSLWINEWINCVNVREYFENRASKKTPKNTQKKPQLFFSYFWFIFFHLLKSKQQTRRRHVASVQGDSEHQRQGITGCCLGGDSRLGSSWLAFKSTSRHRLSHSTLWGTRESNINPPQTQITHWKNFKNDQISAVLYVCCVCSIINKGFISVKTSTLC